MGLMAVYPSKKLSIGNKEHKIYPYLLRGLKIGRVNQVWQTDITYIPMKKGFMYMMAVIDVKSRFILNWSVSNTMDAGWCTDVLKETIAFHGKPEIFNTDQGSQFTSAEFQKVLEDNKIQISENKLHSTFLAELLNPRGSHGQKDIFVQLFIKRLIGNDTPFDTINARVDVEKHIGFISEDKKNGGRIDLCINDKKGNEILIENKLYAADQENQLVRYSNYNKDATLFYLCLDGRKASEKSCGEHYEKVRVGHSMDLANLNAISIVYLVYI